MAGVVKDPDETLLRYVVDDFNSPARGTKSVPFEGIDFSIYSTSIVGFETSVNRMTLWIKAIMERYVRQLNLIPEHSSLWKEEERPHCPEKTDKIIVHLKRGDEQILTVTIFITTGRIQAQGKWFRRWANLEFIQLLNYVNKMNSDLNESGILDDDSDESLLKFLELKDKPKPTIEGQASESFQPEPQTGKDTESCSEAVFSDTNINYSQIKKKKKQKRESAARVKVNDDAATSFSQPHDVSNITASSSNSMTPKKEATLCNLKETVAKLESQFVTFQANYENENQIKCNKIAALEDKITQLQNSHKAYNMRMENKLQELEDSNSQLLIKMAELEEQNNKLRTQKNSLANKYNKVIKDIESLKSAQTHVNALTNDLEIQVSKENNGTEDINTSKSSDESLSDRSGPVHTSFQNESSPVSVNNEVSVHCSTPAPSPVKNVAAMKETDSVISNSKIQDATKLEAKDEKSKPGDYDVILLCDSNGRYLNPTKLGSGKSVKIISTFTTDHATKVLQSPRFSEPKAIVIHVGTNNIDRSNSDEDLITNLTSTIHLASAKFEKTKILFSELLPRGDIDYERIEKINHSVQKNCSSLTNVHTVHHSQIRSWRLFADNKHLNKHGVALFATSLKAAIFGTSPRNRKSVTDIRSGVDKISHQRKFQTNGNWFQQRQPLFENRPAASYASILTGSKPQAMFPSTSSQVASNSIAPNDNIVRLLTELIRNVSNPNKN